MSIQGELWENKTGPIVTIAQIQDLRTDKKDLSEYKEIVVKEEHGASGRVFYNEFELIEKIKALVKAEGNDATLGEKIREMFPL